MNAGARTRPIDVRDEAHTLLDQSCRTIAMLEAVARVLGENGDSSDARAFLNGAWPLCARLRSDLQGVDQRVTALYAAHMRGEGDA
jgi:hypothetical protein